MSTRTFKQYGLAYGSSPTTITAKIDGVEVFSGQVTTVDQPLPTFPNPNFNIENTLFSWTKDSSFSGTTIMEISVQGSPVLLAPTLANYSVDSPENQDIFSPFYRYEVDGVIYSDPLSNESINGTSVFRGREENLTGQWYWLVSAGSTFTATINVQASQIPPSPPPVA